MYCEERGGVWPGCEEGVSFPQSLFPCLLIHDSATIVMSHNQLLSVRLPLLQPLRVPSLLPFQLTVTSPSPPTARQCTFHPASREFQNRKLKGQSHEIFHPPFFCFLSFEPAWAEISPHILIIIIYS